MVETENTAPSVATRVVRGAAVYGVANVLQNSLQVLLLPVYTAFLKPSEYGVVATIVSVSSLVTAFAVYGFDQATIRLFYDHKDDPRALGAFLGSMLASLTVLIGTIGAVLLATGRLFLGALYKGIPLWPLVALGLVSAMLMPFTRVLQSVLQAQERPRAYATISLGYMLLRAGVAIALLMSTELRAGAILAGNASASGVFACISVLTLVVMGARSFRWAYVKQAMSYALPLFPHTLFVRARASADYILLNRLACSSEAGGFGIANSIAGVMATFSTAVNRAYQPVLYETLASDSGVGEGQLGRMGLLVAYMYSVVGLTVALFSREILSILAHSDYHFAAPALSWAVLAGATYGVYSLFLNTLLYNKKKSKLMPVFSAGICGTNVALAILLVPKMGAAGAAFASFLTACLAALSMALITRTSTAIPWPYAKFALLTGTTVACWLGSSLVSTSGPSVNLPLRAALLAIHLVISGLTCWGDPFYPLRLVRARIALRRRHQR